MTSFVMLVLVSDIGQVWAKKEIHDLLQEVARLLVGVANAKMNDQIEDRAAKVEENPPQDD
jgi:hypothetical protein